MALESLNVSNTQWPHALDNGHNVGSENEKQGDDAHCAQRVEGHEHGPARRLDERSEVRGGRLAHCSGLVEGEWRVKESGEQESVLVMKGMDAKKK